LRYVGGFLLVLLEAELSTTTLTLQQQKIPRSDHKSKIIIERHTQSSKLKRAKGMQ
jgi:hypothetical protein